MNEPLPCCLAFAALALQQADENFFFLASQSASLPTLDNRAGGQMSRQAGVQGRRSTTLLVEPLRTIRLVIDNWTDVALCPSQIVTSRRVLHLLAPDPQWVIGGLFISKYLHFVCVHLSF